MRWSRSGSYATFRTSHFGTSHFCTSHFVRRKIARSQDGPMARWPDAVVTARPAQVRPGVAAAGRSRPGCASSKGRATAPFFPRGSRGAGRAREGEDVLVGLVVAHVEGRVAAEARRAPPRGRRPCAAPPAGSRLTTCLPRTRRAPPSAAAATPMAARACCFSARAPVVHRERVALVLDRRRPGSAGEPRREQRQPPSHRRAARARGLPRLDAVVPDHLDGAAARALGASTSSRARPEMTTHG